MEDLVVFDVRGSYHCRGNVLKVIKETNKLSVFKGVIDESSMITDLSSSCSNLTEIDLQAVYFLQT